MIRANGARAKARASFVLQRIGGAKQMAGKRNNPRYKNGALRRKYRARLKAEGRECGICRGALGPIHYEEPSDAKHPLSFVVDEIYPVSRWEEFGYSSPEAAALDWSNLQAAHYCCNAAKSNKINFRVQGIQIQNEIIPDGEW